MSYGPSDRYYDPPEPPGPCCHLAEDGNGHRVGVSRNWKETVDGAPASYAYCLDCDWLGPSRGTKAAAEADAEAHNDHDVQACLAEQAEAAAEDRADRMRDEERESRFEPWA